MEREVYKDMPSFKQVLTDAGVILASTPEHIGDPTKNNGKGHWPNDHDGIEHWHIKGEIFRPDGTPESLWITYWKDTLGYWGVAPGSIVPDRANSKGMNRVKPFVVEPVPDEAVALVKELPDVLPDSVARAGNAGGCAIIQALVLQTGMATLQKYVVYTDEGSQKQAVPLSAKE